MAGPAPTRDELEALLAQLLAGAAGSDEAHWRALITITRTSIIDDIRTNWRVAAAGCYRDRHAIDRAVEVVRPAQPYISW
jgi:hypothetical protein